MFKSIENLVIKSIVSSATIVLGGFILFNLAFMLAAVFVRGTNLIMKLSLGIHLPVVFSLIPFVGILFVATVLVFRSNIDHLLKATFFTMPLMSLLITVGVLMDQQPKYVPISLGAAVIAIMGCYFYLKKMPWVYYFALLYVAVLAIYVSLSGIDI